ncbi:penicillin-binding protein [Luteolibacter pohnpeiensis]|uniref:Penicillin-binding protein n=1 Tax=Luteolibacter pohnpeiensis TaxID=454153 RepID=A0A934S7P9_9BACT|nr:transglycosylase domain-containing protein [Luteolibacter pohnpeiensis]MBK1882749.1 penicillin-binding protein [Luteolibacter pohnpeiensis]
MSTWRPLSRPPWWQRWLPEFLHGPVKIAFILGILGTIAAAGLAFFYFSLAMRFDLDEIEKLPAGTVFLDRKGVELPVSAASSRKLATREDLPDFLVKALQAREDARFFEHSGVDVRGLARATVRNIKDWEFTQGASTLTMQLARNTYDIRAKSLHRKFLEIALTLRVESRYTKDQILTAYLNRIYFGSGADGIEQASQTYFGRPTRELNDNECAMIVGIIRGPHIFSPLRNLKGALEQRDQTLDRMIAMGFINEARKEEIQKIPLHLMNSDDQESRPSYAFRAIESEFDRIRELEDIPPGKLTVITTLDSDWQSRLEEELNRSVESLENEKSWNHPTRAEHVAGEDPTYLQFAAVTTETKTGAVLALIGGRDFRHSRYNRATNVRRDLGSAFEPFVAAAAAERGKLVLAGRPVQTGRQIGPAEVERLAKRCGLAGPFLKTEDLFRGSVAASPMEMSVGLATLGNDGKRPKPYFIQQILNEDGDVLYTAEPQLTPALSANAARDARSVLHSHAGTRCFTGATGSEREAWTLRLGPSGSTAIWLGFDVSTKIANHERLEALLDEFVDRLGND